MCCCLPAEAQFGGRTSYDFLNIPAHGRLAAMSGVNVSYADHDVNFFMNNPALVGDSLVGWFSAGYLFYVGNIGQASIAGTFRTRSLGVASAGIQHISYGEIEGFDAAGNSLGTFSSGETAVMFSKSHQVGNFRMGITSKFLFSNIVGYRAAAFAADLGGLFIHPEQELAVGLVIKNLGFPFSSYSDSDQSGLPFDVQAGITVKPEYMPVRFTLSAYNLVRPGDSYDDPSTEESLSTFQQVMNHTSLGAEVIVHRNVQLLMGYNFLRQQELRLDSGGGGSGFTLGMAATISTFQMIVAGSRYSTGNMNYTFTLAAELNRMILRKRTL